MKIRLVEYLKYAKIIGLITICIVIVFFLTSVHASTSHSVQLNLDEYSSYPKVIQQLLPSFFVEHSNNNNAYYIVDNGATSEAFDVQAVGALQSGLAKRWHPQYLATVVIAVDKDQRDGMIRGWNDLLTAEQEVAFLGQPNSLQMQVAAIAYGLEGDHYSLDKAIVLLSTLYNKKLLTMNSSTSPITICFDYQAVALNQSGRNLTIIVPSEGTFTYQKGLLSNEKLVFEGDVDKLLAQNNLPTLDGQRDALLYPNDEAYSKASQVIDVAHFNRMAQKTTHLIERNVLQKRQFMSIDHQEHLLFALLYLIVVAIWTVSLSHRATQKGIRYAALFTGVILTGWTLVRLVRYQIIGMANLSRYLWYSYYIFQLSLPLVIVWMAWAIDKPKNETFPPKWWRVMAVIASFLILFVFTNDWHGHIFNLDLSRWDWDINYSYSFGYYIVLIVAMGNLLLAFFMMALKSMKSPRSKGFIGPLLIFILFGVYNYKYIIRDPFVYETDVTIVTGVFAMLMFETCIRFGLIPVNSKYIDLFERSPLKLQVFNKSKERALASTSADVLQQSTLDQLLIPEPFSVSYEDSLIFSNPIPGGYAVWQEDMSKINYLYQEIRDSTYKLEKTNALLTKEMELKRALNAQLVKKELMHQFETEMAQRIQELSARIEKIPHSSDKQQETTRVALLLTYIKRRSNYFFLEKKQETIGISQVIVYLEELAKIAEYTQVQIATVNEIKTSISCKHATILYDFFYEVLQKAVKRACPYLINNLEDQGDYITMYLLPSEDIGKLDLHPKLNQDIVDAKGFIVSKSIEGTIGISISFLKGGLSYD